MDRLSQEYPAVGAASDQDVIDFSQRKQRPLSTPRSRSDRRQTPRVEAHQRLIVEVDGSRQQLSTVDLSLSGARIRGNCPVEIGQRLPMALRHQERSAAALAEITRIEADVFSVRFLVQSPEFKALLSELIYPTWIGGLRLY